MTPEIFREKAKTLILLGKFLNQYGASAFRIEKALSTAARAVGIEASFFYAPTYIMGAFSDTESKNELSYHVRLHPGEIDLEKLCLVNDIGDQFLRSEMSCEDTQQKLLTLEKTNTRYPRWLIVFCFGLSSASLAVFLNALPNEIWITGAIGIIVGIFHILRERFQRLRELNEAVLAFITACLAFLCQRIFPEVRLEVLIVGGLITLLPGMGLTIGLAELAANHLISGTSRMMGAIISLLKTSFGVVLGSSLMTALGFAHQMSPELAIQYSPYILCFALFLGVVSVTVLFNAPMRYFFYIALTGSVGVLASRLGALYIDVKTGGFLGGLAVGATSNLLVFKHKRPALLTVLPGLLFLVPGALGFQSLSFFSSRETLQGVNLGIETLEIGVALVAGLFFGNVLIDPRKSL